MTIIMLLAPNCTLHGIEFLFIIVCSSGDIRLSSGANATEGRVEICSGGSWGTVCDDFWDAVDAQVVCNQLGFHSTGVFSEVVNKIHIIQTDITLSGATAVYTFPAGTGSIILDNVRCTGSESRLIDCSHNGIGLHNCGHSEDAGVRCLDPSPRKPGTLSITIILIFITTLILSGNVYQPVELMVRLGLLVVLLPLKVEWRSVSVVHGAQFVMITGAQWMLKLYVDS